MDELLYEGLSLVIQQSTWLYVRYNGQCWWMNDVDDTSVGFLRSLGKYCVSVIKSTISFTTRRFIDKKIAIETLENNIWWSNLGTMTL